MQEWIVALIGVAGTLAGTGLGYRGARAINRDDRAAALRDQMRSALSDYLGVLVVSVSELRDLPPRKQPLWLDQAVDKLRGEQGSWLARRRAEYRLTGDRYRAVAAQLAVAAVRLQTLPLPPDVRAAVDAANRYIERLAEDRTPELIEEWSEVHARLIESLASLDERTQRRFLTAASAQKRLRR